MTAVRTELELDLDLADPLPDMAQRFIGTPARYTAPRCDDHARGKTCHHALRFHEPQKPYSGRGEHHLPLTVGRDGSAWIRPVRPMRATTAPVAIPTRTRENMADCAVHGLSYWSEARGPATLWGVDEHQHAVIVHIDRRRRHSWLVAAAIRGW